MHLQDFEKEIGYEFKDKALLKTALTHTSYAYENSVESNEKLEFLGDSILEFLSSKYLFHHYQNLKEGEMTKVRAAVVCEESLYQIAIKHNFSDFLYLGKSESSNHAQLSKAILADSVEAVIAAIYLDSHLEQAEKFIIQNLKEPIKQASLHVGIKDYKTVLQEKLQVHGNVEIKYYIIKESGPDHNKLFESKVECNGKVLGKGIGKSKKMSEMIAAKNALENLKGGQNEEK